MGVQLFESGSGLSKWPKIQNKKAEPPCAFMIEWCRSRSRSTDATWGHGERMLPGGTGHGARGTVHGWRSASKWPAGQRDAQRILQCANRNRCAANSKPHTRAQTHTKGTHTHTHTRVRAATRLLLRYSTAAAVRARPPPFHAFHTPFSASLLSPSLCDAK